MKTKAVQILDNQIELSIYKVSLRTQVIRIKIERAFDESAFTDDVDRLIFENFKTFLSRTADVTSLTKTPSEDAISLLKFWDMAKDCQDYKIVFDMFQDELDLIHNNAWIEAVNQADESPFKVERVLGNSSGLTEAEQADPLLKSEEKQGEAV